MEIGAFEAGVGTGIVIVLMIIYKLSGVGFSAIQTRYKNGKDGENGDSETLPNPKHIDSASNALFIQDIRETKGITYSIKNSQELNQQATLSCFKSMAEKEETQIKLLTDIRDSMIRQEGKRN